MVCFKPLQATFTLKPDGKKLIKFSDAQARLFKLGCTSCDDSSLSLPCGRCIGCRLERSRQWAVRLMHEADLYSENCFLTLTYSPEALDEHCPSGSLDKSHIQRFLKRLRRRFSDRRIRYYYCGEYGDQLGRPHFHVCLFNLDFPDKVLLKVENGFRYYTSPSLADLWRHGFVVIADLTFDSAAYVARYCTKKITGDSADLHYSGRSPEFGHGSTKPGLGHDWFFKYFGDVFPSDELIVDGYRMKPPRYYDKLLERTDPAMFEYIKGMRVAFGDKHSDDQTHRRLLDRETCTVARFSKLMRRLEDGTF